MKTLVNQVKTMGAKTKHIPNMVDFLDNSLKDRACQNIIQTMNKISLQELGCKGTSAETDPDHFQQPLNRVTIDGNEDYRLVLFFIKKGQVMPLHDHPNMSVYFKLMYGKLSYYSYDKIDNRHKYNQFSNDEYDEYLETNACIDAKKSRKKVLDGDNMLLVRPSIGNMHKFKAEEDSCFFDICLPNYTAGNCLRRITYFHDLSDHVQQVSNVENHLMELSGQQPQPKAQLNQPSITKLQFHLTPPKMPFDFELAEIDYRGDFNELGQFHCLSSSPQNTVNQQNMQ